MARTPIYITTAPAWQLITVQVIGLVFFLISIIVTFAGSGPYSEDQVSTYDCEDSDQHVWDPATCHGHQYATEEYKMWTTKVEGVGKSSRYWDVSLRPYRKISSPPPEKDSKVKMSLTVNTTIYYYDTLKSEWVIEKSRYHKIDFKCHSLKFQGKCDETSLAYEDSVKHKEYRVVTEFVPNGNVADMVFITERGNAKWTTLELCFTFLFLLISTVALIATGVFLARYKAVTWNFEQVASLVLLVLLILYNNPFFALVYLTRNLGSVVLGSIFKTLFLSGMLLFWLMFSDRIHHRGAFSVRSRNNLFKLGTVIIFFVMATVGCIIAK